MLNATWIAGFVGGKAFRIYEIMVLLFRPPISTGNPIYEPDTFLF
jgi:hypothetical protein